jgi:hypothetical protein
MVYNRVNKRKTPFVNMKMNDGCLEIHSEVEWLRLKKNGERMQTKERRKIIME